MSGGGQGTTQTVVEKSNPEPPAMQRPFLQDIYSNAQQAYNQVDKTAFQGPLVADPTAAQLQGLAAQQGQAQAYLNQGFGQNVVGLANDTIAGNYLMPGSNPALQGAIDAAVDPIQQRYLEQIIPSITSGAAQFGAYGGTSDLALREAAGRNFANEALNAASGITYANYAAERNRQMEAPGVLQTGAALEMAPGQLLFDTGTTQQGFLQDQINEALAQYQNNQQAPWAGLPEYASLINTGNFSGGTREQTTTAKQTGGSPWLQVLQGLLGGAATVASGGNAFGFWGVS